MRLLYSPGATVCESHSPYIEEKAWLLALEPRAINMSVLVAWPQDRLKWVGQEAPVSLGAAPEWSGPAPRVWRRRPETPHWLLEGGRLAKTGKWARSSRVRAIMLVVRSWAVFKSSRGRFQQREDTRKPIRESEKGLRPSSHPICSMVRQSDVWLELLTCSWGLTNDVFTVSRVFAFVRLWVFFMLQLLKNMQTLLFQNIWGSLGSSTKKKM